jgi:hypothetical protein
VYTHRVCKAVEYMVCDALLEADPVSGAARDSKSVLARAHARPAQVLQISKKIRDPAEYQHLTDCIVRTIEASKVQEHAAAGRFHQPYHDVPRWAGA